MKVNCPHCGKALDFDLKHETFTPEQKARATESVRLLFKARKLWRDEYEPKNQFPSPLGFSAPIIMGLLVLVAGLVAKDPLWAIAIIIAGVVLAFSPFVFTPYLNKKEHSFRKKAIAKMREEHPAEYKILFNTGGPY